jgi:hypothetical protein
MVTKNSKVPQRLLERIEGGETNSLMSKVGFVLHHYPETRSNDISLAIQVYRVFYSELIDAQDKIELTSFYDIPKAYDIQRYRAKIQNEFGLYPNIAEKDNKPEKPQRKLDKQPKSKSKNEVLKIKSGKNIQVTIRR